MSVPGMVPPPYKHVVAGSCWPLRGFGRHAALRYLNKKLKVQVQLKKNLINTDTGTGSSTELNVKHVPVIYIIYISYRCAQCCGS